MSTLRKYIFSAPVVLALFVATLGVTVAFTPARASEQTVANSRLLNGASALSTAASLSSAQMSRCRETAVYVVWGTGVASGVVTVETAADEAYTGTWAPLQAVTFSGTAPKQDVVQITGVHWALRTRISTVLAGGTVSTYVVCN